MAAEDERAYHAESRRFHMALIAPARMQRLTHMYEAAWNMTEPARPMSRVDPGGRQLFYDDHDRMLAAFVARDAEEPGARVAAALTTTSRRRSRRSADDPEVFREHGPDAYISPVTRASRDGRSGETPRS